MLEDWAGTIVAYPWYYPSGVSASSPLFLWLLIHFFLAVDVRNLLKSWSLNFHFRLLTFTFWWQALIVVLSTIAAEVLIIVLTAVKTVRAHNIASGTGFRPRLSYLLFQDGMTHIPFQTRFTLTTLTISNQDSFISCESKQWDILRTWWKHQLDIDGWRILATMYTLVLGPVTVSCPGEDSPKWIADKSFGSVTTYELRSLEWCQFGPLALLYIDSVSCTTLRYPLTMNLVNPRDIRSLQYWWQDSSYAFVPSIYQETMSPVTLVRLRVSNEPRGYLAFTFDLQSDPLTFWGTLEPPLITVMEAVQGGMTTRKNSFPLGPLDSRALSAMAQWRFRLNR